jgi:type II restriction/modification system DNA methylase subunit YeeA
MNKANLKSYAPQARKDFIAAVTVRANQLGLSFKAGSLEVAPAQTQGDVTVIAGQAWPSKVSGQREKLIESIRKDGFEHTMEAVAYTWFNRFAALRYMELHDYLGHGHRALSSTAGGLPDILTHATDLSNDLPGLDAAKVTELKLAGNRDGELYRMLLVAQCNALSRAMPFLFERIDDDSELLLPDNLLRSDSVIAKLVEEIPEEDWAEVEIIGWLYQFYISEKKDQVIGKVVKSEDIPAATQLFTPNWIVQYLVQNSVGRLWLMANPQSTLAKEWQYYITPAEQTPEVQAQLDALIQTRVREDGDTLNPETISVMDPACGSGHILVVAYDVLKAIYLERGYQPRAIPRLILEKNLYGLDIDDRAAQMAGFALLMKARADDRRLFTATDDAGNLQPPKLNVLSLQESKGLSVDELATHLAPFKVQRATISALVETFEHAKTFGSLIQIPYTLKTHLSVLPEVLALVKQSGELYATAAADDLLPLVQQAEVLAMLFDAVVANPPYMGSKGMNSALRDFAKDKFPEAKSDLFAMFIVRGFGLCKLTAFNSMVTMQGWMFLSSFESLRQWLLPEKTIQTMAHLGARAFSEISGEVVQTTAFSTLNSGLRGFKPTFFRLIDGQEEQKMLALQNRQNSFSETSQDDFKKIPGTPLAYWASQKVLNQYLGKSINDFADPRQGLATGDNGRFLRFWQEVSIDKICLTEVSLDAYKKSNKKKWYPVTKGGSFRRWYGNCEYLIAFDDESFEALSKLGNHLPSKDFYFREGATWSTIASGPISFRFVSGSVFETKGSICFPRTNTSTKYLLGLLNSKTTQKFLEALSPNLDYHEGPLRKVPYVDKVIGVDEIVATLIELSRFDFDCDECSVEFARFPLIGNQRDRVTIQHSWEQWEQQCSDRRASLSRGEEALNRLFIHAYGLQEELTPEVPESQITLARADREKDCQRLISYAIGCMMGRYSLDEPGLIYAHAGNVGFEPGRYATFSADADGILPITDELWFADDAPSRIREFLRAVWGPDSLEENMTWLAESLGTKASETPDETIRRYIADKFFKDHLQTYKKRPIYWLFSSGKQGAFQALVYLHRYSEGTLARLRAEYVVPLTGKIQSRVDMLQKDAAAASSTVARNKLAKEVEKLKKKHAELLAYDEQLRHYADMRITLDLDDGVKVNYGKFGDLLAEVKAITGGASDD